MKPRTSFLIVGLCLMAAGKLEAQQSATPMLTLSKSSSNVNIGVKGGFNSSMFFIDELSVGSQPVKGIQNNYKVGYFGAVFCRVNLKNHHFLQPECSFNISKGSVSIRDNLENSDIIPESALIKISITSVNLPVLYGYKFIDQPPYGMSFFLGPQIAWVWQDQTSYDFSGFYQQDIRLKIRPFNASAIVGLAVNVSNIFFDFRYELGMHNLTNSIRFNQAATELPYQEMDLHFKHRRNVMSFSVGAMF